MYGYELVEALARQSKGVLAMGQSTLYPLLYNLEAKGLIEGGVARAESGRERKYYRLTGKGRKRLVAERRQWQAVAQAMADGCHWKSGCGGRPLQPEVQHGSKHENRSNRG